MKSRTRSLILRFTLLFLPILTSANTFNPVDFLNINARTWKKIQEGHRYVLNKVKNISDKTQSLNYIAIALHPKSCQVALRTLSRYEDYSGHIGLIKKSTYDEKLQQVFFDISHSLFPIDFYLKFKIPRIKTIGDYPFNFDIGFLKGLVGNIRVREVDGRCLFQTTSFWEGKHTGFPATIIEIFSITATKIGMDKLFRISLN